MNAIELNRKCTLSVDSLLLKTSSTSARDQLHHHHNNNNNNNSNNDPIKTERRLLDVLTSRFRLMHMGGKSRSCSSETKVEPNDASTVDESTSNVAHSDDDQDDDDDHSPNCPIRDGVDTEESVMMGKSGKRRKEYVFLKMRYITLFNWI